MLNAECRRSSAGLHEGRQTRDQTSGAFLEQHLAIVDTDVERQSI
jgi:hypothetical protein